MNDLAHIYIFISYTTREEEVRQVRPFVEAIIAELRARGYGKVIDPFVWWDADRMGHFRGPGWLRIELAEAIAQCRHLLAFVSFSYWQSCWCRFEWEQAFQHHVRDPRRRLVPIFWKEGPGMLETHDPHRPGELPPPWSFQCIDASKPYGWWNISPYLPEDMPRIVNEVVKSLGDLPTTGGMGFGAQF